MVLEGCAEPQLGCCILLRGGSLQELVRLKKIVKFMLLACYNWKLEKAFLGDIEAVLPEPGTFDDDDNYQNDKTDEIANDNDVNDQFSNQDDNDSNNDISEGSDKIFGNTSNALVDTKNNENEPTNSNNGLVESRNNRSESKSNETNVNDNLNVNEMRKSIEIDDPLQKSKQFSRRTESDKTLSCGVPIKDFSDPLQSRLSVDDDVFLLKEEAKLKADSHSDR